MNLKADAVTIGQIFNKDNTYYIIPRFQRPYSWEEAHCKELWEDLLSNLSYDKEKNSFDCSEYFIGPVVLVNKGSVHDVVDGQQRMTTLTIILSALYDIFKGIGEDGTAAKVYEYIETKNLKGEPNLVLQHESDKKYFRYNIVNKRGEDKFEIDYSNEDEQEIKRFDKAFEFYKEALSKDGLKSYFPDLFFNEPEKGYLWLLRIIQEQILTRLKVISIEVKEEENAYVIFETLNSRGMCLTTIDLVKNDLFRALPDKFPIDDAKVVWQDMSNLLTSRGAKVQLNTFFRHYWISKYAYKTEKRIYREFKAQLKAEELKAQDFLAELKKEANYYAKVSAPQEEDWPEKADKVIYKGLKELSNSKIVIVRPLLIALLSQLDTKKLKKSDLRRAVKAIQQFHFVHTTICSLKNSGLESKYSKFARDIRCAQTGGGGVSTCKKIINNLISELQRKMPNKSEFKKGLSDLDYSKHKKLIEYIFRFWEDLLSPTKETTVDHITLEHILPQSSNIKGRKKGEIQGIGNLIPLDPVLNQKAGNKSFEDKKKYYERSELLVTKEFVKSIEGKADWGYSDIKDREKEIADTLYDSTHQLNIK